MNATEIPGVQSVPAASQICGAVLFDGSCPLCSREIAMYRSLKGAATLDWVNVADPAFCPPAGITKQTLLDRFHFIKADGALVSGADAFILVWSRLAGWKHLAQVARLPGAAFALDGIYRLFLKFRPLMQRAFTYCFPLTVNAGTNSATRSEK